MAEEQTTNKQETNSTVSNSGDYETAIDENVRKTGVDDKSDAKTSATPEAPENDTVPGSPNQGTESR
ncbi:hypothetical protein JYQ62_17970 [Nostoc sp. UHCC 0702]|nr:hypothetical protein JYQ62_17970 [Nostoc sp. UHCC 0702]